ncbi:MAG: hypothetical protein RBR66_03130 [Candidatus Izemoplasmatales bacterium]|jgi:hypothetical protein|nr:hypothetical protein [Candidatus Izemoplasmatales bacterium]
MKKVLTLLLGLMLVVTLFGCGETTTAEPVLLENTAKDYYLTGQWNGWDTKEDAVMTAIYANDERVASISEELEGVKFLYILEFTLPAEAAGWGVNYIIDGVNTTLDGNLTVKVIRTTAGDPNARDWWAQSPESGEITNLTPETLFMPDFVETAETSDVDDNGTPDDDTDDVTYTSSAWNDNPAAFEAGTYYAVFAEFEDGTKGLALIPVTAE